MEKEWLDILRTLAACIAVTNVSYSHLSRKNRHLLFIEDLAYKPVSFYPVKFTGRADSNDSTSLLSPVLEGVQAIIGQACSILYTIYSKYTTLVMQLIVSKTIITTLTHI